MHLMSQSIKLPQKSAIFSNSLHPVLLIFLLGALLNLTGCPAPQYGELDEELAKSSWANLEAHSDKARKSAGPYNSSISFRLTLPDESYRLGAYIWSNSGLGSQHPLRLDLQSSVGTTVAKLKEEPDCFLLYDVKNNVAVVSKNPSDALMTIGIPMPFILGDISLLLNGRYLDFFNNGQNKMPVPQNTTMDKQSILLINDGPRKGYITINPRGFPVSWNSLEPNGWKMELGYQDVTTLVANTLPLPGPNRIVLSHPDGYAISMQVKSLKKLPKSFTSEQLELLVPSSATIRELKTQP